MPPVALRDPGGLVDQLEQRFDASRREFNEERSHEASETPGLVGIFKGCVWSVATMRTGLLADPRKGTIDNAAASTHI